ncbi:hypothetical protein O2K51_01265 [Apibacter raozihei]|uniref:hypothetical protein n=1 Tax=Apibacter raozihei TaxID=2500547 RepID=UPI000FE3197C|nr:hypothetical protein [Apibacter raozihei]
MKHIIVTTSLFFSISLFHCQERKNNLVSEQKNIEIILEKQLKQGANNYIDDPGVEIPKKAFEFEELNVSMFLVDSLLNSNGYKTPIQSDFNKNIKLKLNRIIDNNSDKQYLYINFFNKCDRDFNYFPNNGVDYNGIYIDKVRKIISKFYYIPELIDYQKNYPNISKIENQVQLHYILNENNYTIELWKDLDSRNDDYSLSKQRKFNQQLLISRNKYLFNDDQSQFAWLINNDEDFMESLVTTFGYTKDQKLLKWVMEKNYSKAGDFVKNNVFVKDCKGNLEIREDILKYIEETTTEQKTDYIEALYRYTYFLFNPYNDKETSIFNEKEKYKIFAYAANTYDQLFRKYSFLRTTNRGRWNMLGSYFYNSSEEDWKKLKKEFVLNNYYNLPHLKSLIEYAEEFDGLGSPD